MICKVCGSETKLAFTKEFRRLDRVDMKPMPDLDVSDEWKFFECTWCHALQTDAMDLLSWEDMAKFYTYDDAYLPRADNRAHRAVRFLKRALRMFPQGGNKALCYGAGMSPEPKLFKDIGLDVETCDFGEQFTFTPTQFEGINKKYNIISSMEVLEHLRDPKETLSQILHHLEPGGVFIASTGLWSRLAEKQRVPGWWYLDHCTEGHIFIWTLQALDMVAQANGCYVTVMGNNPKLCMGMGGAGQAPIIIRKYDKEDL